jgi:hypothetical protein
MNFLNQDHNGYRYKLTDLGMAGGSFWQCLIRIDRQVEEGVYIPFWDQSGWEAPLAWAAVTAGEQIARALINGKLSGLHGY